MFSSDVDHGTESDTTENNELHNFRWTHEAVILLLDAYEKRWHKFQNPKIKKKTLWIEMQDEMQENGCKVDEPESLDRKMRNLKNVYKRIKGNLEQGQISKWPYYDKLDDLFSSTSNLHKLPRIEEPPAKKLCPSRDRFAADDTKWSTESVEFFLDEYYKRRNLFFDTTIKKKDLWLEIFQEMKKAGFPVESKEGLDRKMRNLKHTFKEHSQKSATTGKPVRWQFFEKMKAIFDGHNSSPIPNNFVEVTLTPYETNCDGNVSPCWGFSDSTTPFKAHYLDNSISEDPIYTTDSQEPLMDSANSSKTKKKLLNARERKRESSRDIQASLTESKSLLRQRDSRIHKLKDSKDSEMDESPSERTSPFDENNEVKKEVYEEISSAEEKDCGLLRLNTIGKFIIVCGFCRKNFNSLANFAKHLNNGHPNFLQSVICNENLVIPKIEEMDAEHSTEPDVEPIRKAEKYHCICGISFNCEEDLKGHNCKSTDNGDARKSQALDDSSNSSQHNDDTEVQYNEHQHDKIQATLIQSRECKFCRVEFETKAQRVEHETKEHAGERPYVCWFCKQTFRTAGGRKYHVRMHTGERPFKCNECSKSFAQKRLLDAHGRKHAKIKYACRTCGKIMSSKTILKYHERRHKLSRSCVCEYCGKSFAAKAYLKDHLKRHTAIRDVLCTVCGRGFFNQEALRRHMPTHTGETSHECDVCGMKCSTQGALTVHLKLHSEQQLYVCHLCGKEYIASTSLSAHMKKHRETVEVTNK